MFRNMNISADMDSRIALVMLIAVRSHTCISHTSLPACVAWPSSGGREWDREEYSC